MEFAITLLLHQKKDSGSKVLAKSDENEKRNNSNATQPIMKVKPTSNEWQLDTPSSRHVEEPENKSTLMENARRVSLSISVTHVIDFVAVWIYLILFLAFNCIYWKTYY